MPGFFSKLLSIGSDKELKEFEKVVARVEDLNEQFAALSDAELKGKTAEFRERYAQGESLDDMMPEAFAAVREASGRVLGMRHFPFSLLVVQPCIEA